MYIDSTVNEDLQTSSECFILITVKDKDLIGTNELIGEAFLPFQRVGRDYSEPEQILLPLTQPPDQGDNIIKYSFISLINLVFKL